MQVRQQRRVVGARDHEPGVVGLMPEIGPALGRDPDLRAEELDLLVERQRSVLHAAPDALRHLSLPVEDVVPPCELGRHDGLADQSGEPIAVDVRIEREQLRFECAQAVKAGGVALLPALGARGVCRLAGTPNP